MGACACMFAPTILVMSFESWICLETGLLRDALIDNKVHALLSHSGVACDHSSFWL